MKSALAVFLVLVFSSASFAQTPIKAGDSAPFDGVLLTKEEAAKIIAEKEQLERELQNTVAYEKRRMEIECNAKVQKKEVTIQALREKYDVVTSSKNQEIETLYKQLEAESSDYSQLWFAAGFALGSVTSMVIFFAAVQTQNFDIADLLSSRSE